MSQTRGVIVASDAKGEWLLPWWWERYASTNTLPVAFIDLGMTTKALSWCENKGQIIPCAKKECISNLSEVQSQKWTEVYGSSYISSREAWFQKPHACLLSPFQETLWIDIDCEVLSPVDEAFAYLQAECAVWYGSSLSVPSGLEKMAEAGTLCNSGVIAFKKNSLLIKEWAKRAEEQADQYFGDECILSTLIYEFPESVTYLPEEYNWRMSRGVPLQAKIIHWKGEWGKKYIAAYGGIAPLLKNFNI
jgi:hypothetical protein